jgi:hypothetical protein
MNIRKVLKTIAISSAVLSASAFAAQATIVFSTGGGGTGENVLFTNSVIAGNTLTTQTNAGTGILFTSDEPLVANGGQTGLTASDGNIDSLSWTLTNSLLGYTTAIFRVDPSATGGATALTITGTDQFVGGTFTQTLSIVPSGFFTVTALGNELITSISFTANGQLDLVDQVRLGGVTTIAAVPEPATWAMIILGFAGVGFLAYRRQGRGRRIRLV